MPLTTILNRSHMFIMEDSKNFVASRWQEQPPLKTIFISVLQMKSSSTWLIHAPLCEGPIFYFYVESTYSPLSQASIWVVVIQPSICWFIQSYFLSSFVEYHAFIWMIYLWKLSMTAKRLLLSMWFLVYKLWYKRLRSKYKYNLFIVLWPRTNVCVVGIWRQ
jgi:hypothetical protein